MIPHIFEDENILVLNKPAGISVHGDGKTNTETIADLILRAYPKLKDVGEPMVIEHKNKVIEIPKPGIVHRLDKDTSGVLLIAKNQEAFLFFKKQFQEREAQKEYHAFIYGWLKDNEGSIDAPIGRSRKNIRAWAAGRDARGELREAHTKYEVIERYRVDSINDLSQNVGGSTDKDAVSYLKLFPKTGRTHQLRVHLKYLNHPIIADSLYAPNREPLLGFTRLALHARALTISLPNGKSMTFTAPFPEDFEKARATFGIKV